MGYESWVRPALSELVWIEVHSHQEATLLLHCAQRRCGDVHGVPPTRDKRDQVTKQAIARPVTATKEATDKTRNERRIDTTHVYSTVHLNISVHAFADPSVVVPNPHVQSTCELSP